ncbi:hypothetical protein CBR_g36721 [Chara braunii]|uniref:IPT/TIG domain-containing protein n=1 Tax=Chara braunii TaxID=69332 RepID=A0A388LLI9_CHABU|nr:hypothetical protein CBR_g36721 [Chara braunii]|eukprot:GBG83103.1 hypothetical protein CBR_g36721 [Chara braunii]
MFFNGRPHILWRVRDVGTLLAIIGIQPASGPLSGGTRVQLFGKNFNVSEVVNSTAMCYFDSPLSSSVAVVNFTSSTAVCNSTEQTTAGPVAVTLAFISQPPVQITFENFLYYDWPINLVSLFPPWLGVREKIPQLTIKYKKSLDYLDTLVCRFVQTEAGTASPDRPEAANITGTDVVPASLGTELNTLTCPPPSAGHLSDALVDVSLNKDSYTNHPLLLHYVGKQLQCCCCSSFISYTNHPLLLHYVDDFLPVAVEDAFVIRGGRVNVLDVLKNDKVAHGAMYIDEILKVIFNLQNMREATFSWVDHYQFSL